MNLKLPETFDLVRTCGELGIETTAGREAVRIAMENCILLDKKQKDYGPRNITGFGTFGIVVRMNDKFERIKTLFGKRRRRPVNESILDSFRDISNYAVIALLVEGGRWPDHD